MANNGVKIWAPVNEYDIQYVFSEDLGGDWARMCTYEGINMWARYKPIRNDSVFPISHNTRKANFFGLQVPFCNTVGAYGWVADVMNGLVYGLVYTDDHEDDGWKYLLPQGDRTAQGEGKQYYRITDFVRPLNDTTDPYYNTEYAKGYNHNAKIPFQAFINSAGVTERYDSVGLYYEVNVAVSQTLVVTFFNSVGDDLHLQDFINIADYGNNIAWRPVLQVFNDYVPAGGAQWYRRSQPDYEVAGDAITNVQGATWSVAINLNDANFNQFYNPQTGQYSTDAFHLCIGVGCVNPSFSSWKDGGNALFLLPYTKQQYDDLELPFYYRFRLVMNVARLVFVEQIQFRQFGTSWVTVTSSNQSFTVNTSISSSIIRMQFTITRLQGQSLEFVGEFGRVQNQSNDPLKIKAEEMVTGEPSATTKFLVPQTSGWQNPVDNPVVRTGQTTDTTTLYANLDIGSIPTGGIATFHLLAYTGATINGQEKYDNIGSFSINMQQYT